MEIQPGTAVAGKYRVVSRLSGGGMGSVWLGHHDQLDAPVVLKFMHGSLLDVTGSQARFEREAKAAAAIRSPYIVHVYDHGIDAELGMPFIVMEYLEGEDLASRIKSKVPMTMADIVRICEQACKGLHRAHKLGIVHRDLKPGNIFLSGPDDDMVKILDFGIAKETGQRRVVKGEATTTGQVLGSPHYMSPEQARGQTLDGRSDLWSLAVIMYRLVTGERPFKGNDIGDLIVRICTDDVPVPSSINPKLSPVADKFFQRAFERDPDARFQTAKAFAAELKAALLGVTVSPDASQELALPAAPNAASPSWDSRSSTSSSYSAAFDPREVDQDALTRVADAPLSDPGGNQFPSATPIDASRTLTEAGEISARPKPASNKGVLIAAVAALSVLLIGAAWAALGSSDESVAETPQPSASTPAALPPQEETASASAAATEDPSAEPADSAATAEASASQSAAPAKPPPPRPFVRRRRTKPVKPQPQKKRDPDLGY